MRQFNPVSLLRSIALVEAVSFLILVCVAMPLKYLAGMPGAVKAFGWAHGALFVALGVSLLHTMVVARWPIGRGVIVFISSLLPFGPFVLDGHMRRWTREFAERQGTGGGTTAADPQ